MLALLTPGVGRCCGVEDPYLYTPLAAPSRLCFASKLARKREYSFGVWRSSIATCGDPIVLIKRSIL